MVEARKAILYFVLVLIATILFGTLATIVADKANSNEMKIDNTFVASTGNNILSYNGTSTLLSPSGEGVNTITTATRHNQSWMEFDGVNDKVIIPFSSELNMSITNLTVMAWVKVNNNDTGQDLNIISSGNREYHLSIDDSKMKVACGFIGLTDGTLSSNTFVLNRSQWTHVVCFYNNTDIGAYVNGIIDDTDPSTGNLTVVSGVYGIGGQNAGTDRFFKGAIDEVRIYNISLSDTQISAIYSSGRTANSSLPSDGLVLWYSFNEGSGTTVYDKSGNNNHGT